MGGEIIGLVSVIFIFSIPMVAIWTTHQRKLLELKLQLGSQGSDNVRSEFEALRNEVRSLRDTTMQYDLSFDTALQRLEQRVDTMERRAVSAQAEEQIQVGAGR